MRKIKTILLFSIEWVLPWGVLVILAVFTYAIFFKVPYIGFRMSNTTIRDVYASAGSSSQILPGDRIVQIGSIELDPYMDDLDAALLEEINREVSIDVLIERNDQQYLVNWVIPGPTRESIFNRSIGIWWMSYVLWLAGTLTAFLHRPKDSTWIRLIAIYYLLAIVIILTMGPSGWHIWKSAILLRSVIWLSVPLFLHFHWDFPKRLFSISKLVWLSLYIIGFSLSFLEWVRILPVNTYLIGLSTIIAGSLMLFIVHYIFQPNQRKELGVFNDTIFVVAIPILLIRFANLSGLYLPEYAVGGAFIAFPSIPGAYFLLSYWDQIRTQRFEIIKFFHRYLWFVLLGSASIFILAFFENFVGIHIPLAIIGIIILFLSLLTTTISFTPILILLTLPKWKEAGVPIEGAMQLRANRLLSSLFFFLTLGFFYSLIIATGITFLNDQEASMILAIGTTLSAIILTLVGYPSVKRFIDKKILKIDLPFYKILQSYIDAISTSLDRNNLASMLTKKILPSLLIRESALVYFHDSQINILFSKGVDPTRIPRSFEVIDQLIQTFGETDQTNIMVNDYPWIRLIIHLRVNQETCGVWFFGKKDPDDYYFEQELEILKSIANQTALALIKIQHKEQIDVLLQENIQHAEEERRKLARDLHDDVLNGLVALGMTVDDLQVSPNFETQYQYLTNRIRKMINGLRPPTLDQGLWFALQNKAQELQQYTGKSVSVEFNIPYSEFRYPLSIEGHVYRIIQQACDNALIHAHAKNIHVYGELDHDKIILRVEDDGKGFSIHQDDSESNNQPLNHYGLKIMKERAELIDADFSINSELDRGTSIHLSLHNLVLIRDEHQARLKAEKALIEKDESFQNFLATSSFGIILYDQELKIRYANKQAAFISGYSIPELLNLSVRDLTTQEEYQKIVKIRRDLRMGKISEQFIETLLGKKDGEIIPIQISMSNIIWYGKNYNLIILSDITTKKQIELALQKSNENILKIFDNAFDGIALVNKNGDHLYVNNRYAEMLGYTKSELLEKSMKDTIPEETIIEAKDRLSKRFSKRGKLSPYEIYLKKKDGNRLPVIGISTIINWQGADVIMAYMRDISQQKEAEQSLRLSEEKFRSLVENTMEGILVSDEFGNHIYTNQAASDITGYGIKELNKLSFREIVHPSDIPEIAISIKRAIIGEEHQKLSLAKIITKTGKCIPVEYSASATLWEGRSGFIVVFREISERMKAEESITPINTKYKSILDHANDGILVTSGSGKFIYANKRTTEITGYKFNELLNLSIKELSHPDEFQKINTRFKMRFSGKPVTTQYPIFIITKEGMKKEIEITASSTFWESQAAVIVIMREVSKK